MPTYVIIPAGELKGTFHRCSFRDACDAAERFSRMHGKPFRVYRMHNSIYLANVNNEVYHTGTEAS